MKVLFVCLGKFIGGGEIYTSRLAIGLCDKGVDVTIASSSDIHKGLENVDYYYLSPEYKDFFLTATKISKILRNEKFDIVHFNGIRAGYISFFCRKPKNTKFVLTKHLPFRSSLTDSYTDKLKRSLSSILLARLDKVITVSNAVKADLPSNIFSKAVVVKNGVPDLGCDDYKITDKKIDYDLIYLGRLVEHKGILSLIHSLIEFNKDSQVRLNLVVAGVGELDSQVERLAMDYEEFITYKGFVTDTASLISKSKYLILPSKNEGMPLSILESYSLGVPVIACDIPGVNEIVDPNVNGFLIENDSLYSMMEMFKVITLLNNNDYAVLTEGARSYYTQCHTLDIMVEKTKLEYDRSMNIG